MIDAENLKLTQLPEGSTLADWAFDRGAEAAEARQTETHDLGIRDPETGLPLAKMVVRHDGTAQVHDLTKYRTRPVGVVADRVITDPGAFADYVDRHKTDATTLWADGDVVRALLDDHDPARASTVTGDAVEWRHRIAGPAGWARHRASLALTTAPEWKGWKGLHRVLVPQAQFAEVVEEFANTLVTPDPETMLLIAQSITVASTGQVSSAISLRDGAVNLTITEQLEAGAGSREHPLSIPQRITFTARRWLGVPPTEMTARLRFRAERGGLKLGLIIDRLEDVEDAYRRNLATSVAEATGCPVYAGTP